MKAIMREMGNRKTENGFVSILTVLMFMILTTIVTVSFVTLTLGEQRQTLNDDLAKGAYDAAQAGIEDAKRAIRHCRNTGCETALYNQSCPGFFETNQMKTDLGLTTVSPTTNAIRVGEPSANQRYTCVTVSNVINKFWGELDPNSAASQTVFLPLKGETPFNSVKISWSMRSGTAALPSAAQVQTTNPSLPNWNANWPAAMRTMVLSHPSGNVSESSVTSRSTFFVPASGGVNNYGHGSTNARIVTRCNTANQGGAENVDGDYLCQMTITGVGITGQDWYLQLAPYYQAAAFKVELFNNSTRVNMVDAGYLVDSTGAVSDVYRRVQVMLGPDDVVSPSSSIQSGEKLCKNFRVTGFFNTVLSLGENCDPTVSVTPPVGGGGGGGGGSAQALLGGYCSINVCNPGDDDDGPGGGGGNGNGNGNGNAPPTNYTQRIFNASNNPSSEVAGCRWAISDGTVINNQYCNFNDSFLHTFPTTPYPPRVRYDVTLTVTLRSGEQATYTGAFYEPNYTSAGN
ncbi:TPA: hypothetical protein DCF80_01565 [Candidatus Saccharibacteria bacterium]|nr:hypothetical protein [Candidatus Saccharibacteria bacterium]